MSADFIDSNVFVYLLDETAPSKRATAERLIYPSLATGGAQISFQVVQETLNVMVRKFQVSVNPEDTRRFLDNVLAPLWRIMPTPDLYSRALEVQSRYGFRFYDALIVASALSSGCTRLYSEDLQHGQRIEGLTIVNPFLTV